MGTSGWVVTGKTGIAPTRKAFAAVLIEASCA